MEIRFIDHEPGFGSYVVMQEGAIMFGPATYRECERYVSRPTASERVRALRLATL